jgi:hypothetical protein
MVASHHVHTRGIEQPTALFDATATIGDIAGAHDCVDVLTRKPIEHLIEPAMLRVKIANNAQPTHGSDRRDCGRRLEVIN